MGNFFPFSKWTCLLKFDMTTCELEATLKESRVIYLFIKNLEVYFIFFNELIAGIVFINKSLSNS
ncbi:MAG: hypothetical protein ACP5F5_04150 [Caldisericum sp.]